MMLSVSTWLCPSRLLALSPASVRNSPSLPVPLRPVLSKPDMMGKEGWCQLFRQPFRHGVTPEGSAMNQHVACLFNQFQPRKQSAVIKPVNCLQEAPIGLNSLEVSPNHLT